MSLLSKGDETPQFMKGKIVKTLRYYIIYNRSKNFFRKIKDSKAVLLILLIETFNLYENVRDIY